MSPSSSGRWASAIGSSANSRWRIAVTCRQAGRSRRALSLPPAGERRGRGCSKGRRAGLRGNSLRLTRGPAASARHRRCPRSPPTDHPPSPRPKNPTTLTPDTWPPAPARGAPSDGPYPSRPTSSDQPSAISFQVATRTTKEFGLLVPVAVRPIGSLSDSTANLYSSVSICGFKSFGPHRTTPHVIHGFPGLPDAPGRFPESA